MRNLLQLHPQVDRAARSAGGRIPVIAFVADADSERVVKECLAVQALGDCIVMRGGIERAISYLGMERSPQILIVDISGVDLPVSQVHALADECEPGVTVIAIGDRHDIGLYRDLMHAGVSDYIVKPLTAQLVAKALQPPSHFETGQISQKLGKMVAFVGARGGVGATTLATNLAWHLAHRQHRRAVLLDLDLQNGDCALALNLKPAPGLRDALDNPTRIDTTLLERAMTPVGERLFVLSSEEPLRDDIAFTPEAVEAIVAALRPLFHYLIVDVPRLPSPANRRALEIADIRVIVADHTLRSVRDAVRLRTLLGEEDREHRNILAINRSGEGGRHAVRLRELTDVVGLPTRTSLPFEPRLFARAALDGILPATRRGRFADAIANLAAELSGRTPLRRRFWGSQK